MEINPLDVEYYFKIFALCCASAVGGFIVTKMFKYILFVVMFFVLLSAGVFFAESFTEIDVSNIDIRGMWQYINYLFSVTIRFFLDIFNNGGILVVIAALIGGFYGMVKSK